MVIDELLVILVVRVWTILTFEFGFDASLFMCFHVSVVVVTSSPCLLAQLTMISFGQLCHLYAKFVKSILN